MIEKYDIEKARSFAELEALMNQAAHERNCELNTEPYEDQRIFFLSEAHKGGNGDRKMIDLARLLFFAVKQSEKILNRLKETERTLS